MATTRRAFLQLTGLAYALDACANHKPKEPARAKESPQPPPVTASPKVTASVPQRALGKTGAQVSILGVGGAHLGRARDLDEATRMVDEALDAGVNFFDNAWEYNDGKSEDWLGRALKGKRERAFVMTKVCTHGRDRSVAMEQLEQSLKRLGTDHLDLWQIHECIYDNDPDLHFAKDGVVRALEDAKRQGKVRFVGFTGHKDPRIHLAMLAHEFPFDTLQMPLNPFDGTFRSFERFVLPKAQQQNLGVIGMKSLGGFAQPIVQGALSVEEALRYAMSLPGVSVTVSGMDSLEILRQNLKIASEFQPLDGGELESLRARCADAAGDGHFELYKTTTLLDAAVGRKQHGYPTQEELPV